MLQRGKKSGKEKKRSEKAGSQNPFKENRGGSVIIVVAVPEKSAAIQALIHQQHQQHHGRTGGQGVV